MQFDDKYESLLNEFLGGALRSAGSKIRKAATSDRTKKVLRGAGNLAADFAKETGKVAAEVGGEGIKAAGRAVGSLADKAIDAADKGISKLAGNTEDGEGEDTITIKLPKELADTLHEVLMAVTSDDASEDGEQAGHAAGSTELEARNARSHELAMAKAKAGISDEEDAERVDKARMK
jgi:hypothetical protein